MIVFQIILIKLHVISTTLDVIHLTFPHVKWYGGEDVAQRFLMMVMDIHGKFALHMFLAIK
jgi:hypothetical protein